MALNFVFIAFFVIAFVMAIFQYFVNGLDIFSLLVQRTFDDAANAADICIGFVGVFTLWMGIMRIGEKGGAINIIAKLVAPFFNKIFPEIPKGHPVFGNMIMNFSANMLGLDNAATPMGIKAMKELQKLNPNKDTASNSQIMFLVLNTSGLTLIPISILALRYKTLNTLAEGKGLELLSASTDVFVPILVTTFFSSLVGIITVSIIQKINLLKPVVLAYLGGLSIIVSSIIFYFSSLPPDKIQPQSSLFAGVVLFLFIIGFIGLGVRKKINVYDAFIDGAKEGFETAVKIIPYLVGILVAIGLFRVCGALDLILDGITWCVSFFTDRTEFVEALPTAIMKPLSGGGARAAMLETMNSSGLKVVPGGLAETFPSFLSGVFQGSTETTFYVLAVYFGAVGIKDTRYALGAGLIADFAGIITAVIIGYLFYAY
jgi:spore maturation protein SpmA|tara:strand:+ start:798 stop:2087 length:1290 start_codon:yes stop_codon:yes gene_type:complete